MVKDEEGDVDAFDREQKGRESVWKKGTSQRLSDELDAACKSSPLLSAPDSLRTGPFLPFSSQAGRE